MAPPEHRGSFATAEKLQGIMTTCCASATIALKPAGRGSGPYSAAPISALEYPDLRHYNDAR
jgi:hypothetical protein